MRKKRFYFKLFFDSKLTDENRNIMLTNQNTCYEFILDSKLL